MAGAHGTLGVTVMIIFLVLTLSSSLRAVYLHPNNLNLFGVFSEGEKRA